MTATPQDLVRLGWSLCPLDAATLLPSVDPEPLVQRPLVALPDGSAWGLVTGPISRVWAGPVERAPAVVAAPGGAWGLWPTRPRRGAAKVGTVVPVLGPGVRWSQGSPEALVGGELARALTSAQGGDPEAAQQVARLAARGSGLAVAPDVGRPAGWEPVSWPSPPAPIPWEEYLPPSLRRPTLAITENTGGSKSLTGLMVTAFASAALMARIEIEMWGPTAPIWREHNPAIFALGIAPPSAKKSPIFRPLEIPWKARAAKLAIAAQAEQLAWTVEHERAKADLHAAKTDEERQDAAARKAVAEPAARTIYLSTLTPAAILEQLGKQPSVLLYSQEANQFFTDMMTDRGPCMNGLLHGYAGEAFGSGARISRRINIIPGVILRAGLIGTIQPKIFYSLSQNRAFFDSGLMARITFGVWEGDGTHKRSKEMDPHIVSEWGALMERLWAIPEVQRSAEGIDKGEPRVVRISHSASSALLDLETRMNTRTAMGQDLYLMNSWAGKAHGTAARLATVWALCDNTNIAEVPDTYVHRAISLVEDHLLRHAIAAWNLAEWPAGTDLAQQIWARAKSLQKAPPWTFPDVQDCAGDIDCSPQNLLAAMRILEDRGFVRRIAEARAWIPNPLAS